MGLCVNVIPSHCCDVLKVSDASTFTDEVITNLSLSVTPIGFDVPVVFSGLTPNFINNYNSVDLNISAEVGSIPDGLYTIVLTADVDGVSTSYSIYYLQTCKILNCYYDLLCSIKTEICEPSSRATQKLKDLSYIRMLIDAAISKAQYCDAPDQATALLEYANSLIKKYKIGNCVTC